MKKNKPTIFGEESFIIPNMAEQFYHKEMEFRDDVLVGRIACDFNIDKEKVKRQLELCSRLENIDKTDLIDIATKKKFADKDYEIKVLQKALELACDDLDEFVGICKYYPYGVKEECPIDCPDSKNVLNDYFKTEAKEILENEKETI